MRSKTYDAHETARMHALHGLELASFARRAAAFAIDFTIAAVLFLALIGPVGALLVRAGLFRPEGDVTLRLDFFRNWHSVAWLATYFALATYLGNGRTPGKRLLGIRVVSLVHDRVSLWHSIERALGYAASALEFGFGFVQYFLHPNRRTVHDRIAETIVVRQRATVPRRSSAVSRGESAGRTPLVQREAPAHAHAVDEAGAPERGATERIAE